MKSIKQIKRSHYDKYTRDPEGIKFYHSAAWLSIRDRKLELNPLCEACEQEGKTVKADMVHHSIPITNKNYALDIRFLVSLCNACHNRIETEIEKDRNLRI